MPTNNASAALSVPATGTSTWFAGATDVLQRVAAIIVFVMLWELAPRLGLINPRFLPPISSVVHTGIAYAMAGNLHPHVLASLGRAAGGFALAVVTAVPLGILFGWSETFEKIFGALFQCLRQINPVSLLPVFIIFLGIGYETQVALIYWVVFWPIFMGSLVGVKYVDRDLVRYAKSMALSDSTIFAKIIIPSALPSMISGMRLAATYALIMLVVAEMVGANNGLGYLVQNASYIQSVDLLYVGILILMILGLIFNYALVSIENRLGRWRPDLT